MEHEKETAWFKNLNRNEFKAQDQPSFVALSVKAVSVFKSCLTLRDLGDNSCHLVESPLEYLEDKGYSRPLQQY